MSGYPEFLFSTGLRQFGQNPRLTTLPMSDVESWYRRSPEIENVAAGTTIDVPWPVPLAC